MALFHVSCTATADITELWRVEAADAEAAIEAIEAGQGDFIRQTAVDNERGRDDWIATECRDRAEYDLDSRLEAARDAGPELRDAARAEAKGAIAARDQIAAAVGRVEQQLDVLLSRALVAENALRAIQARESRGDAPAVMVAA